jgi:3-hydroxyacyl-CoA dehydrogenase
MAVEQGNKLNSKKQGINPIRGMRSMNIGIVGFGKMGSAIFRLLADKPYNITVLAIDEAEAKNGETKWLKGLKRALRRGTITEDEFQRKIESLIFTHQVADLASAELIIEAIFEDYNKKVDILRKLESVVKKNTVLVTNTSSISIVRISKALKYKDRFCGLHFFHPVMLINLVEIIRSAGTPDKLVKLLIDFCKDIGRQAIVVNDPPGSTINLILLHYYLEALYLLEEGQALPSKIDSLAKKFFYVGPCESLDVIGIDFFLEALAGILDWFLDPQKEHSKTINDVREVYHMPDLPEQLISEGRLGKKVSKGIYIYEKDKPLDDALEFYYNDIRFGSSKDNQLRDELIENRLLYSVFNGCLYSLEKGLSTLKELDIGVKEVLLMKDGPFTMMQNIGRHNLKKNFDSLAQNVGKRFEHTSFDFLGD